MTAIKHKFLLILTNLLFLTNLASSQTVLEFSSVKLISGSFLVPAGTSMSTIPPKDTTLVIPAGKVWKFETVFTGLSQAPFTKVNNTADLIISINNTFIFSGYGTYNMAPFWLPAGSYSMKYYLSPGGTPPVAYYFKFFFSVLEYSTTP